jgi:hypothetical protein
MTTNPSTIYLGDYSRVSWRVSGANYCVASSTSGAGNWSGSKPASFALRTFSQLVTPTTSGTKYYTLTCYNPNGNVRRTTSVTVNQPPNQPPTANLLHPAFNPTLTQGSSFSFSGTGTDPDGSIVAQEWRVGSCSSGTLWSSSPSFTTAFNNIGTYRLYFRVRDDDGAWSTNCPSVTITVNQPPNQSPTATILHPSYNTTLVQGASLSFSGTGSDPDGYITAYRWTATAPYGLLVENKASFTWNFANIGTYNMCLSVQDDDGAWSTNNPCRIITVNPPPAPTVSLSASPTSLYLGSYTRLSWSVSGADYCTASSTSGGNWSGSKSSSGSNSQYVYPYSTGTKTYTLTCTSAGGSTSRSVNVSVNSIPNVAPTAYIDLPASNQIINEGDSINFEGHGEDSDGSVNFSRWSWGSCGGSLLSFTSGSSSSNFSYTFDTAGTYQIYYQVQDNDGAWSSCKSITITVNSCVCSESSNNYCSGTLYNDSCGNSVCPGSYLGCPGLTCSDPTYQCNNGEWTMNSDCTSYSCSNSPLATCNLVNLPGFYSDNEDCGTATCERPRTVTLCHEGNVHEQTRGYEDTCSPNPTNPCGEKLVDCSLISEDPVEECETGYICKEINPDNAECVPKSATWSED